MISGLSGENSRRIAKVLFTFKICSFKLFSKHIQTELNANPFRMERHFPILKDKIDRKNPNIPETAHCYQTKNETNKNNFFFVSSKILPENKLQGSQFFLLWKLKRGQKESKSFHLCVKSSCYTKGH